MELEKRSSEDYDKPEYNLFVWVDTHPENLQNNFLNKDWDINIKFGSFKITCLHKVAMEGTAKAMEIILNFYKEKIDVNISDITGATPLHYACSGGYIDVVKLLLKFGADINTIKMSGSTPLHLAILHGHLDLVENILLNKSIKVDLFINDSNQNTCFDLLLNHMPTVVPNIFDSYITPESRIEGRIGKVYDKRPKINNHRHYDFNRGILCKYDYSRLNEDLFTNIITSANIDIINHHWFTTILDYKWKQFAKKKFFIYMFVYIIYLFMFSISTILQINIRNYDFLGYNNNSQPIIIDNNNLLVSDDNIINSLIATKNVINIFDVGLLILTTYYILKEVTEVCTITCKIWFNMWNIFDIIQYILIYCLIPLKILNSDYQYVLLSILAPIFWIKFLYFGRGFKSLGPFVRMLFKISVDIVNFVIFFSLFLIGFAHCFYILYGNSEILEFKNTIRTAITLFNMNLGDFNYDSIENSNYPVAGSVFFIIFNVISVIVLLNLLIAIMGDSYNIINQQSEKEWRFELSKLILYIQNMNQKLYEENYKCNCLYVIEKDRPIKGLKSIILNKDSNYYRNSISKNMKKIKRELTKKYSPKANQKTRSGRRRRRSKAKHTIVPINSE